MGMTRAELMRRMSYREYIEHLIDYTIEPWGPERGDLQAGIIAAEVHNANVTKRKDLKSATFFMPYFKNQDEDTEDLKTQILKAFKNYGDSRNT